MATRAMSCGARMLPKPTYTGGGPASRNAGHAGLAGREVAGLLGFPGTSPVRAAVGSEEAGREDLQQECGEGQVCLVRGSPWFTVMRKGQLGVG
jgi:hypothetical protein